MRALRVALYLCFFASICVVAGVMLAGNRVLSRSAQAPVPPIVMPPRHGVPDAPLFERPSEPVPAPAAPVGPGPTVDDAPPPPPSPAIVDARPARPRIDISSRQKVDAERYNRVLRRFYPGEFDPPGARVRVVMTVASDGTVPAARTEASTFDNPAFEAALVDEAKRMRYPDDERYRSTDFSFEFVSVRPLPQRPLADIETRRDALLARIEKRRAAIFARSPPPPDDARLKVTYRVMPSGAVEDARVERSTFQSSAFARAVADEVGRLRFDPNPGYAPTRYTFEYGSLDPADPPRGAGRGS